MIPSNNFNSTYIVPEEACEGAEDIMKVPFITFGRTLPEAINFFIEKVKELKIIKNEFKKGTFRKF